jgi:hypothetical protein
MGVDGGHHFQSGGRWGGRRDLGWGWGGVVATGGGGVFFRGGGVYASRALHPSLSYDESISQAIF